MSLRERRAVATIAMLLAGIAAPLRAQQADAWSRLDSTFAADLRRTGAPGGVMALVRGDSIVHVVALGVRSAESRDPVTADTRFRVASATKMLTGLAAADLSVAGALALDRPVSAYVTLPSARLGRVTMAQLLSHTTGLRDAAAPPNGRSSRTLRTAARAITDSAFLAQPGEIYSYANPGFTVAGLVIEAVARRPYAEVVQSRALAPLGMHASTFDPLVAMTHPLALGHARANVAGGAPTVRRPFVDDPSMQPRGGLVSTAPDMARLLIALMDGGRIDGRAALDARAVATMLTSRATMPDDTANHYGLGVRLVRNRGRREVGHYGGGFGYRAVVRGLAEARVGVVILVNQDNVLLDATADSALALLAPPTFPAPVPSRDVATAVRGADARRLAGRYRNGGGDQVFRLVVDGDNLALDDDGDRFPVVRVGTRTLRALAPDGSVAITWTVVPSLAAPRFLYAFGRAFRRE